ncbi:HDOD domain-containing protein [Metapseudomonas otitidis]|uniref:HDOD domain-containing protein n=1 Tax=Metapseudomonas otitidis TaxID=319939 RepID=UPI003CEFC004
MDNRYDRLKFSLLSHFMKGEAKVPQMPETSMQLRKLLSSEHASLEQVTRLLHSNPPLAAYLMQFAATPLLRNLRPGVNLQEVIARLGMQRLNNLVLSFTLQNLLTTQDPVLQKVFRHRWNTALLCAAYCACLAQDYTRLSLEDAMLAGLVQDIGSLPLLDEADQWPEIPREEAVLEQLCDQLSADIGVVVLTAWKLPPVLVDCARHRTHWDRQHGERADLADLVQVASRLCASEPDDESLPQLPAWRRVFRERADQLDAATLRTELASGVAFWFKLMGGKGHA